MTAKISKLCLMPFFLFSLIGCTSTSQPAGKDTVTDMIGRNVQVNCGAYKKVVCIGAGALRLYSYIGDVSFLSGVEDIDNSSLDNRPKMFDGVARPYFIAYEDVFKTLPSVGVGGPNAQVIEAEKILNCNPDLIISEYEDATQANALQEKVGVPVITVSYGNKGVFDETLSASLTLLGKVLGKEDRAFKLTSYIANQKTLISMQSSLYQDPDKKVYICGLGNWGTTDYLTTWQNYENFNVANITNVISGFATDGVKKLDKEKFEAIGQDIDVMIIDAAAVKNIKPLYQDDPSIFDSCKAWQSGEVYLEMPYNAYYTNIEIALMNAWYNAKVVYPEGFTTLDMNEKTNEITKTFLGKEMADEIFSYPYSYGGYQKIDTSTFFNI